MSANNYADIMRLVADLANLCGMDVTLRPASLNRATVHPVLSEPAPSRDLLSARRLATAKAWIKAGLIRTKALGGGFAADPAWDILLNVYVSAVEHHDITATNAGYAGQVPLSTGLRWIAALEANGWITRIDDTFDRRRRMVALTVDGTRRLEATLDAVTESDSRLGLTRLNFIQKVDRQL